MTWIAFGLGVLVGLSALFFRSWVEAFVARVRFPLGEDEEYLLRAALAAGGRLILRTECEGAGPRYLVLKEFMNPRRIEAGRPLERLLLRALLQPDPSGTLGRFQLTPQGRLMASGLPPFPLFPRRGGSWFNSISRRSGRRAVH